MSFVDENKNKLRRKFCKTVKVSLFRKGVLISQRYFTSKSRFILRGPFLENINQ
jgi:hypothetical protein